MKSHIIILYPDYLHQKKYYKSLPFLFLYFHQKGGILLKEFCILREENVQFILINTDEFLW